MTEGSDREPRVLVLAGLDPSGGAGLLADAEAVRAAGARPLCVATALTVQTSRRARRFEAVDGRLVRDSVLALLEEEDVRAIKIGMIGSAAVAEVLEKALPEQLPRVVDPVLRASSGAPLLDGPPDLYLRLSQGALLTPNVLEAELLGPHLLDRGPSAVLYKGGDGEGVEVIDTLETRAGRVDLAAPRIAGTKRGTGCRLASFIAGRLAMGDDLRSAVGAARSYVRAYLGSR
jgi:hydroxymethylpyrimidine/phosphomethylpyrimidine kinase